MKLSKNFSLSEMFKSATADRLGINNTTEDEVIIHNLKLLVDNVWQPARDYFGPIVVNSAYRSLELNRAIKSKDTSQHIKGEAIDGEALYAGNFELASWISENTEFDQLILEFYTPGLISSGWVHCSYSENNNRKEILTINKNGVFQGLLK
jgi:zinc D-Ala-D-Ala carboxypeptidase